MTRDANRWGKLHSSERWIQTQIVVHSTSEHRTTRWSHRMFVLSLHLHRLHLSFYHGGRWGTTDDFTTTFLHFSLFFTALWDLANSRPVHSLMLSSHLFLCPPCLLPPFTVPCKMVLARPDKLSQASSTCAHLYLTRVPSPGYFPG